MFQGESRSLQDGTDNHDGSSEKDHFPTAEAVTDEDCDDGADEASQIVRCHSDTLVGRALGRIRGVRSKIWIDLGELVKEDGQRQDTSHDTLICKLLDNNAIIARDLSKLTVTKQEKVAASNSANGPVEGLASEAKVFPHDSRERDDLIQLMLLL